MSYHPCVEQSWDQQSHLAVKLCFGWFVWLFFCFVLFFSWNQNLRSTAANVVPTSASSSRHGFLSLLRQQYGQWIKMKLTVLFLFLSFEEQWNRQSRWLLRLSPLSQTATHGFSKLLLTMKKHWKLWIYAPTLTSLALANCLLSLASSVFVFVLFSLSSFHLSFSLLLTRLFMCPSARYNLSLVICEL